MEDRDHIIDEVRENLTLKTLQERVWRLEADNKELKVNNSILKTQYDSQCETQSDILRTLHANLDDNYSKIEEYEQKILRLEQQLEDQKQEFKDEQEKEKSIWESRVAELNMKNEHLEAELNKVSEFRQNKEAMEYELASLKRQLQDQAESHSRDVSAFDRKKAIEIDQLKKDMQRSIKDTREMLKARTKDQLDSTTKRTIMENEQMATELHFQSKETERLLDRTQQLQEENQQLRRNLSIHKDLENELARRTHVYQKIIKKMKQRADANSTAIAEEDGSVGGEESILDEPSVTRDLKRDLSSASGGTAAGASHGPENEQLQRQVDGVTSRLEMVRHEFAQYRRDHNTLTQLQDQSTRLIIAALYELKNQRECDPFPPAVYDENANWQFTNMTTRQKEYFFRVLLEKLNSGMCGSCFPAGPQASNQQSTSSLPQINKGSAQAAGGGGAGTHFSQFLWSVATHGAQPSELAAKRETATKSMQTETQPSDPCFREGLWAPRPQKGKESPSPSTVTSQMVTSSVRPWGGRAATLKTSGLITSQGRPV